MSVRIAVLTIGFFTSVAAFGDWGTGEWGAQNCPQNYAPSAGALDGHDEVENLKGRVEVINSDLQTLRERRDRVDDRIKSAQDSMGKVLTESAIGSISEHWDHKNDQRSYRRSCGSVEGAHDNAGESDIEFPDAAKVDTGKNQTDLSPPPVFCIRDPKTKKIKNTWCSFVANKGYVSNHICNYYLPGVSTSRDSEDRRECRAGLQKYYDLQADRDEINRKIARLKHLRSKVRDRLGKVQDDIDEGTYCAQCDEEGDSTGMSNAMAGLAAVLMSSQQQPPAVLPYGYPQNAYPGRLPGYMNVGPGNNYGTAPGGIGPGAFNCPQNPLGTPQYNGQANMPANSGVNSNGYTPLSDMLLGGTGPGWVVPDRGGDPRSGQYAGPGADQFNRGNGLGANYDPYYGYQHGYNPNMLNRFYDGRYADYHYNSILGAWNGFGYGNGGAPNILPFMGPGYGPGMNGWNGGAGAQYWANPYNLNSSWSNGSWNGAGGQPPPILPYIQVPSIYNAPGTHP